MARKPRKSPKPKKVMSPHIQALMDESKRLETCECGNKSFTLRIENRELIRTCKRCELKVTF